MIVTVRDRLVYKLSQDAFVVASNFDYLVNCGHMSFCADMGDLFAYDLPVECNEDVQRYLNRKYRRLPVPDCSTISSKNCDMDITDTTEVIQCEPITIDILQ